MSGSTWLRQQLPIEFREQPEHDLEDLLHDARTDAVLAHRTIDALKHALAELLHLRRSREVVKSGIYTASKTRHADKWLNFRARGYPVISTWIDEAGPGETSDYADLWARCIRDAASCAALVVYREEGDALKGAMAEMGAALASEAPVYWVGPSDGYSVMRHPLVTVCDSDEQAMAMAVSRCFG